MMKLLLVGIVIYGAVVAAMCLFQRQLMYYPDKRMKPPTHYGLADMTAVPVTTADNVTLTAWTHPAKPGMPTIVYFHGNAGHLGYRAFKFRPFIAAGFGLVAVSYRGYGTSAGEPSENGLYEDARAAIKLALSMPGVSEKRLVLYGESLGSGVAVQMATEFGVGGLALEAPYTSVVDRAAEIYPFVPVRYLIRDRFESLKKIRDVKAPLLVFHGERDKIIPIRHGKLLLAYAGEPKRGVFFPTVGHTDFDMREVTDTLLSWARQQRLVQ